MESSNIAAPSNSKNRIISGQVLEDIDNNGSGDVPLKDVLISLFTSGNVFIMSIPTDGTGKFTFTVPPGLYIVRESNLPGYVDVSDKDGGNLNEIAVVDVRTVDSIDNNFVDRLPNIDPSRRPTSPPNLNTGAPGVPNSNPASLPVTLPSRVPIPAPSSPQVAMPSLSPLSPAAPVLCVREAVIVTENFEDKVQVLLEIKG